MKIYTRRGLWWYYNFDGIYCKVDPKKLIKKEYIGEKEKGIEVYDAIIDKDR